MDNVAAIVANGIATWWDGWCSWNCGRWNSYIVPWLMILPVWQMECHFVRWLMLLLLWCCWNCGRWNSHIVPGWNSKYKNYKYEHSRNTIKSGCLAKYHIFPYTRWSHVCWTGKSLRSFKYYSVIEKLSCDVVRQTEWETYIHLLKSRYL